ncbi:hypothetical protein BKA93DRAFT_818191 [Sparassis latifolia]
MISREFFAQLSRHVCIAKIGTQTDDIVFGGINFPPVANKKSAPLYYPITPGDPPDFQIGHHLYEQFNRVVILREQVCVTDPVWMQFLRRLRHGQTDDEDLALLQNASLITPRHSIREQWNSACVRRHCMETGNQLFICPAFDTIGHNRYVVELAIGMKVMVTMNIKTDLDVANGSRGTIEDIILDENEPTFGNDPVVQLHHPPAYSLRPVDENLVREDRRLAQLDEETQIWWAEQQ